MTRPLRKILSGPHAGRWAQQTDLNNRGQALFRVYTHPDWPFPAAALEPLAEADLEPVPAPQEALL